MQKRPKGWETARDDPNHIGELLVTIDGKPYAAQDIVSCEIERNLLENTAEVGNATAAVLTLEISQGETIPKRAKVVVQYRLMLDDARTDYIPKGTYWINTREKDGRYLKLTCYDAMLMAQQDYLGDVTADDWPQQETACVTEIAQRIGVEIDPRTQIGTGDNHQVSMPVGRTMREVLEQIAAANGGNWCITPAGKLLLVPFAGTGDVLPAVSGAPDCGDVQAITGVRVVRNDTDTPLLAGDETGTVLEVENENGTQALADELAKKLAGLPYAPYTCDQRYIDPVAEAGDKITVGGVVCVAYNIKESLGPSHYADLEAPAEAGELEEEYPYQSTAERVKKQLGTVTASMAEIRKDQKSIEAEVKTTTETVAQNTKDIEAAKKEATEKSEAAADAAKKYADDKLLEYSTTEEVKSLVSQTAENITSEVSKTYATKATVAEAAGSAADAASKAEAAQAAADAANAEAEAAKSNAATAQEAADKAKADAEAAQKAADDAEANAAADATEKAEAARKAAEEAAAADAAAKAAQAEANAKEAAAADAQTKADQALADAKSYTNEQLKSYSTTEETKSLIDQKADSITLNVTKTVTESVTTEVDGKLKDYSTKSQTESAINVALDGIKLGIKETDVWKAGSFGDNTWQNFVQASVSNDVLTITAVKGQYCGASLYVPDTLKALLPGRKVRVTYEYKVTQELSGATCGFIRWIYYANETSDGYYGGSTWANSTKTAAVSDWKTVTFTFTVKSDTITRMYFQPRLDSGATGQVQVRNVSLQYVSGTDNSFQLTKDGVTISSAVLNTSGFASQQDLTTLQLNYDSLQASVIKDGEVRSKFAMSTESVEISTGTITFSGNTLIIDTDNLKLDKNGKLTMSGNLTSETTTDRAYVGDGIIQLSKKVSGSWQDVAKIWADSSDAGMGHLRLFGDSGNTMVDMWANQGSSFLGLYNKNGSHIFKVYGESRSGWGGEGHLEIGGVNGKGILECKYLIIDGHRVALKRVNYKNQEGTSTWEYLLTANQGNGWNW
nr:MAG TPA: tail protein [Caudoviricetes sp.]